MFTSFVASIILGAAPACGPLDLDTALGLAIERSDEVAIKESEVVAAQADQALARALRIIPSATATVLTGPSPEARGNILDSSNSNRSLTGTRPFGRIDVQVIQPLYTWGRLDAASDAASAGASVAELVSSSSFDAGSKSMADSLASISVIDGCSGVDIV